MSNKSHCRRAAFAFVAVLFLAVPFLAGVLHADDWPQWRGPHRDAVSAETGLLQVWPDGGPMLAWQSSELGTGYSSVVVGCGRLFTLGRKESEVVVTALDAATGQRLWTRKIGETSRHPCSTPTLDGDALYALDPDGDLVCLKTTNGDVVWQTSFIDNFGGQMMSGRGYGESPLIDGERLICTPGGPDAAIVALDKHTGAVLWKTRLPELGPLGRDGAGFSSIVVSEAAGVRQYVQLVGRGLVGVATEDGRFLWSYNAIANETANIPTPIVNKDFVFAANGYSVGSVLLKLVPDISDNNALPGVKAEVVYTLTGSQFQNHHGGVVRLGDYLFAGHGNNNGLPTCLEFTTGRVVWKRRGPGVGSAAVVCVDGQLYFRYQDGVVALIDASEHGFNLKGTLQIPGAGGDSWAHPVVANGHLYLREQDSLWVYDVRRESAAAVAGTPPPAPLASPGVAALQDLGVAVEPLDVSAATPGDKAVSDVRRRRNVYAMRSESKSPSDTTLLLRFSDEQLLPDGVFSEQLLRLMTKLPGPIFIDLAGTHISEAGLRQLQSHSVVGLSLELCSQISDSAMEPLQKFKALQVLVLTGTGITHLGLQHIAGNRNLLALDLELCDGVTDESCQLLGSMKQLRSLVLKKSGFERNRMTDSGLQHLQGLSDLEVLDLYGNKVTDAGLIHLQAFTKLRELDLSLLAITDAGLAHLQPLAALERLELLYSEGFAGPMVTDGGVTFLSALPNLSTLNLTGSKLSDKGLEQLQVLTKLNTLQLVRTRVSDDGVRKFRKAVPGCEIIR